VTVDAFGRCGGAIPGCAYKPISKQYRLDDVVISSFHFLGTVDLIMKNAERFYAKPVREM
jgi:hypothetical protein